MDGRLLGTSFQDDGSGKIACLPAGLVSDETQRTGHRPKTLGNQQGLAIHAGAHDDRIAVIEYPGRMEDGAKGRLGAGAAGLIAASGTNEISHGRRARRTAGHEGKDCGCESCFSSYEYHGRLPINPARNCEDGVGWEDRRWPAPRLTKKILPAPSASAGIYQPQAQARGYTSP